MKRLFTRWLLFTLLIVMSITTAMAQKSVLNESFSSGSLPSDWTMTSGYWNFDAGNAFFLAPFENGADTLFSQLLDISELDNKPSIAFSYSIAANATKVNELKVLYRASEDDDWSVWQTFDAATDGQVYIKDVLPDGLSEVQIAIAGAYKLGGDARVYRIAVENKTEASAAPTGLKTEDLTTTSVTLWWDVCESDMFQQYNVKINTTQMTDMSAIADVVDNVGWFITDEFYELEGLTPNTEYWLYVQYDCGNGDVSPWAELSFRTPCAAITTPFSENFEGELSSCFTIVKEGSAAAVSSEYAYNSNKSFKSVSTSGKYNYLILPEAKNNVSAFQVSLWAAAQESGNTYARTVTIGVCTEATAEAFTEVKTLSLPQGRKWEQITVSLASYAGAGKYVALRIGNADKENRLFIDDIRVEAASDCPKPMFVEVSEITPNTAKFKWVETGNASEWNLAISTKPLADPEDLVDIADPTKGESIGNVTSNPYTATGLNANTTYYAYLQSGCDEAEWTSVVEFKTARPVTFPYSEHFDRMDPDVYTNSAYATPDGWVMDLRDLRDGDSYDNPKTDTTFIGRLMTTQNHEITPYVGASLQLKGQSISSGTAAIAMMPAMQNDININELMVSFWALSTNGTQQIAVGVASNQSNEPIKGQQLGVNIIPIDTVTIPANEWTKCNALLTKYTGEGRYITFFVVPPAVATPTIFIDDIEIDYAPNCNAVSTVSATATGTDKATVTWTDASSSTSWTLKVSSTEIDPASADGDIVAAQTVNEKSYDITGMAMGQTYYIYVSPTCGDEWKSTSVTTLVGLQIPYYNDFTNEPKTGSGNGPQYWIIGNAAGSTSNSYKPYVYATAWSAATGSTIPAEVKVPSLYFNGYWYTSNKTAYAPYAIMPPLLNADVKDLQLKFWGHTNSTSTTASRNLYIGVLTNPTDINTLQNVAVVELTSIKVSQQFTVDMSSYSGNGKYIVFYLNEQKTGYFMLDNLEITKKGGPVKVANVAVTESSITRTGATATWVENGTATKWNVRVFDAEQDNPAVGTPVFSTTVSSTPNAAITGLSSGTTYYVYVQSVIGSEVSVWEKTSFFTLCDPFPVPFTEDWESYGTGAGKLSQCYKDTATVKVGASNAPNATEKTGNVIQLNPSSAGQVAMLVFPEMDKPINTLQLTMAASPYTSSYVGARSHTDIGVWDGSTFEKVAEYEFNLSDLKAWDECYVDFSSYTGSGTRIALRAAYATASNSINICFDNIVIEQITPCKKITSIEITEIDSISATVSWEKSATENAWDLKVSSTKLDDPDAEAADIFDGRLTSQTKALTGLSGSTTYYVYVRSVDAAKDCIGSWSNVKEFTTDCQLTKIPYVQDFEAYSIGAGNIPKCADLCGPTTNHSYVSNGATSHTNKTKMLKITQGTKGYSNYFVFPELAIDSVKRLQLSMQVCTGATGVGPMYFYVVGIMTDPNDPATFVEQYTDSIGGSPDMYDRTYKFDKYAGDELGVKFGKYIAIKAIEYKNAAGTSTYAGTIYIDNVSIGYIETCSSPYELKADSIGEKGVKLIWKTEDKSIDHRVRIFASADADPNSDAFVSETVVNDSVAVFDNQFVGNTTYYAYVRKECATTDLSKWSSIASFRTECPTVISLPYSDGFEEYASGAVPDCWTALDNGTNAKSRVNTTYVANGKYSLCVNFGSVGSSSGSSYYQSQIVTPALDVDNLKNLTLIFQCRSSLNIGGLKIEAVAGTDPDAEAIPITTINDITTVWNYKFINLSEYYNSVLPYKHLRFTPVTTGVSIYIDDILFAAGSGVVLPVQALTATAVSEQSITFTFKEVTPEVSAWEIAYVPAGGDIVDATIIPADTTEVTLSGLTPNTNYDIYVRSENSEWAGPLTQKTAQLPAAVPYSTGFDENEENALWNIYNVQTVQGDFYKNYFIIGDAANCDASEDKALYITNDGSTYAYTLLSSSVWATRDLEFEAGTYNIKFKLKVPGNSDVAGGNEDNDYVTAHLLPSGTSFKAANATLLSGSTRNGSVTTDQPANNCYSALGKTYGVNDWTWITQTVEIETSGAYTLAIYWYNAGVGKAVKPVAVDSILIEDYLCTTPKKFEFVEAKATEVTIGWFAGKCKNFEYVVSRYANLGNPALIDAEDKVATGTLTDGPRVTISNLLPNTTYSLYVRTICPDGETDWVEHIFETPCALETLPYTESFSEIPECWILSAASVSTVNYRTEAMKAAGIEAEKWPCLTLNNNGIAILPELAVDLRKVAVEATLFSSSSNIGAVQLGVMDNTWDVSTFKQVAYFQLKEKAINVTGGYDFVPETFSKLLNLYDGTGKVLALKNATSNAVYVKNIKLTELPDCVPPQQVELTDLTEKAITVNWIAGLEEKWEIMLNDSTIENVTTNPYRIENLEQGTVYTVAVRALCDENTKSEWSASVTFQTSCGVNPLPIMEDFSAFKQKGVQAQLICWDNMISNQPIEGFFTGEASLLKTPGSLSPSYTWKTNNVAAFGGMEQLVSWDYYDYSRLYPTYKYRWFITPQYSIEGTATLSFDAAMANGTGKTPNKKGRFFVAISTDNGATWKKEDATNLTANLDTVYQTQSISLDKYAGQAIRVAFYHEGSNSGSNNAYVFIDNVRMNCTDTYPYADNACQGFDYEGYGFSIAKEDLPIADKDSTYYRFAANAEGGCDSTIALTITTRKAAEVAPVYAEICRGESYDFGPLKLTEPNPVGVPYYISGETQYGCDSTIYLYLTVNESDTTDMTPVEVKANQLPYVVDEYYTIPMDASVGSFTAVAKRDGCSFNRYFITVLDNPTGIINITDEIDYIEVYDALGRKVQTLRQGDLQNNLPRGVYMIRTIMKNGNAVNRKVTF